MEDLEKVLILNKFHINTNGLSELINCMKKGLKDKKNKNLHRIYLTMTGKLVESCGKDFLTYGK